MTDTPKRDWKKFVEESHGQSVMVPEKFIAAIKEWDSERQALNKFINELAAKENHTTNKFRNVIYEIQKYFADNGKPSIWTMDIGFDMQALNEGVYVLNLTENRK